MSGDIRTRAIALYDRFTHEGLDRRTFMAELTRIAGSAAAANALLLGIAASPAAAAIKADDPRLLITRGSLGLEGHALDGYMAAPKGKKRLPSVIVIHENRGLNAHIEDVARRLALAGYFTVAPDFLTPAGGTPSDQDKAREMIGKLDLGASMASAVALAGQLKGVKTSNGKVGAVGFCWGGAFVNRFAVAGGDALDAAVSYYGPAPDVAEAAMVRMPLMLHLAGLDERVNATGLPWAEALKKAGKTVEAHTYANVNHAFNNDTSAERYDKAAADLAWRRTLHFFGRHLSG
ncbi:dienelactone hydrolase family protein [Sphingomonas sp. LY54]|uniref:dienelactone hydrolase family protein n=1 Tax=Sphingomonas sp. LY54 TaxID=3095343 RepID=UPI002D78C9D9|nr:dienelactone hydrolase family protein [Sphingomonas sp. LY54]WRP29529.1 dienelactone hydrolase family protein [Sphingomonas sp. LY54]